MTSDTHDIVIVGGGTAGLAIAARLSEDPNIHVAVIECGRDRAGDPQVLTPGMWPLLANTPLDWAFHTESQVRETNFTTLPDEPKC